MDAKRHPKYRLLKDWAYEFRGSYWMLRKGEICKYFDHSDTYLFESRDGVVPFEDGEMVETSPEAFQPVAHFILLGGAEHFDFFSNNLAFTGEDWFWTVPKTAQVGDTAFVYLCAPVSRLVGKIEVAEDPFYNTHLFPNWAENWMAKINFVEFFNERPELTIKGLRQLFPDWRWLAYPRGKTKIPADILKPLLELVGEKSL